MEIIKISSREVAAEIQNKGRHKDFLPLVASNCDSIDAEIMEDMSMSISLPG